jgi:hypothetical protein
MHSKCHNPNPCDEDHELFSGGGIVEIEKAPTHPPFPNLDLLNKEFGSAAEQVVPQLKSRLGRRGRCYFLSLGLSVALGVTLGVIWPNEVQQFWSISKSLAQTVSRIPVGSADQLIEVEALKREISELRDWQERKSVELIALQKANQYLRSSSIEVGPWFSQLDALTYQEVARVHPKPNSATIN